MVCPDFKRTCIQSYISCQRTYPNHILALYPIFALTHRNTSRRLDLSSKKTRQDSHGQFTDYSFPNIETIPFSSYPLLESFGDTQMALETHYCRGDSPYDYLLCQLSTSKYLEEGMEDGKRVWLGSTFRVCGYINNIAPEIKGQELQTLLYQPLLLQLGDCGHITIPCETL